MAPPTPKSARRLLLRICGVGLLLLVAGIVLAILTTRPIGDKKYSAQLGCKSLKAAIEAYIDCPANVKHEFPTKLNDLVEPPFGGPPFLRNGSADLVDPWGKPYQMERARRPDGGEYIHVTMTAPDGTPISQFGIGANAQPPSK